MSSHRPVYEASNAASCKSAAFLKHESVINLCHTIVLKTFPPMFIKGPGYWTCSLASPITLTLTCPTHPVNRHTVSLTDNGILMLRQGSLRSAESIPLQELTAGLQPLNYVVEPDQPFQPAIHWWIVFAIVVILVLLLVTSAVGYSYVLRYARRRQIPDSNQLQTLQGVSSPPTPVRSQGRDLPEGEVMSGPRKRGNRGVRYTTV